MKRVLLLAAMFCLVVFCVGCMDGGGDTGAVDRYANQGEALTGGIVSGVEKANVFLSFLSGIPFLGQFTAPAVGLLGVIGTAAGGINAFLARRRIRKESKRALEAEMGLTTVVKAIDNINGIGKQVTRHARETGTVDVIEAAYNNKLVT